MSPPIDLEKVARLRRRIIATAVISSVAVGSACKKPAPVTQEHTVNEPPAPPTPNSPMVQNIAPPQQTAAPILDGDGGVSSRHQDLNESSPRPALAADGGEAQELNDSPPRAREQDLNDTPPSPALAADAGQAVNSAESPHIPGHPTPNTPARPPVRPPVAPRRAIEPPGNG